MCISCGCKSPEDSHNDERNITVATLQRASAASNLPIEDILRNLAQGSNELLQNGIPDHQSLGGAVNTRLRPD